MLRPSWKTLVLEIPILLGGKDLQSAPIDIARINASYQGIAKGSAMGHESIGGLEEAGSEGRPGGPDHDAGTVHQNDFLSKKRSKMRRNPARPDELLPLII